jgi:hypothetical protein
MMHSLPPSPNLAHNPLTGREDYAMNGSIRCVRCHSGIRAESETDSGLGHSHIKTTEIYLDGDVEWAREIFDRAEARVVDLKTARNERVTKKGPKPRVNA